MNDRNTVFLQEMGLGPRWSLRKVPAADAAAADVSRAALETLEAPPTNDAAPALESFDADQPSTPQIADMSWPQLQQSIATCRRCPRCEMRRHAVAGVGDPEANWLFVGAAPENDDSPNAAPLAGAAQSLFNNMLQAIGLAPGANVYLSTTVKCRATDDRAPSAAELAACRPYLERQIALLQPSVIVALGPVSAAALLGRDPATPLAAMRGAPHRYADLPLIVTHAPRDLLLHPADKREAWVDLCLARDSNATRT